MELILASQSPRRKELLGLFGLSFVIRVADIDETMDEKATPYDEVARVSREKAMAVARAQGDIVVAALDNGGGGNQSQLSIALQVGNVDDAHIAHGRLDLVQALGHIVLQRTGVSDVGVNALFKDQAALAAQVIALPVAGAVGTFAPIFLHILAVDQDLVGGAFIEAGEVAAQHDEVRAHGQGQGNVVVVDDTAVGADGDVDAGLLEIFVAGLADLDQGGRLTAASCTITT